MRRKSEKVPLDFISIGDSTLDVFVMINEASLSCQLSKEECLLCLDYAEKIPVEGVTKINGAGNASNAAVAARRLGLRTAIVSIVGKDVLGREIMQGWRDAKISTKYVQIDPERDTNYSTVLIFQGERTILVHAEPRTYRLPKLDGAKWIYYTALGPDHNRLETELLAHLGKHPEQKLCFNPGTQHLRRGIESLKRVVARADLFIVNKQEAEHLLQNGERPIINLLTHFIHLGAKNVVITDGPHGSYATDGKSFWFCPVFPGKIVERTGAGDAYATTFVCALTWGWSIPDAMRAGTANAQRVVQFIGPQAGLLNKTGLQKALKTFARIKAKPYQKKG